MFLAFNFGVKRLIISTREEFARILSLGVYEGQFVLIDSIVFRCTFCYVTATRRIECFLRIFSISLRYLDPRLYFFRNRRKVMILKLFCCTFCYRVRAVIVFVKSDIMCGIILASLYSMTSGIVSMHFGVFMHCQSKKFFI